MLQELINHNQDLKRLRDEGYEIEVKSGFALLHNVPYVNSNCEIKVGTLVSNLTLSGNKTLRPDIHVIHFIGEHPCNRDGSIITGIQLSSATNQLTSEIVVNHSFSNKPINGYNDYYEKFTRYIEIITAPAYSINPEVTAKTYNVIESDDHTVFNYYDTNSSRAEIGKVTSRLENQKVAIIGLGGTGSYVLDLIAKTPIAEIHIFDGDEFLQHNAFRSPGAPSIDKLREKCKKTDYFYKIYNNMHKYIIPHGEYINITNIDKLLDMNFVFICVDEGEIKREIINKLIENKISFIDVGIGVNMVEDSLFGTVRITTCTPQKIEHIPNRISFVNGEKDEYSTNIQIADLNALNAALAVIKWKKLFGFYQDLTKEYNTLYTINDGEIFNEDKSN